MKKYIKNILIITILLIINIITKKYVVLSFLVILIYTLVDTNLKNKQMSELKRLVSRKLKRKEKEFNKSRKNINNEYNTFLESLDLGTVIIDSEGVILYKNEFIKKNFEFKNNLLKIKDKELVTLIRKSLIVDRELKGEIKHKDNFYSIKITPIKEDAKVISYILVFYDITDIKNLSNSQKVFISDASHELKTPLTSIINVIDLFEMKKESMKIDERLFEILKREARRMELIIFDLLNLIKLEQAEINKNDYNLNIKEELNILLSELRILDKEIVINVDVEEIKFDQIMFIRLFRNLLKNASKYSKSQIEIKVYEVSNKFVIEVKDDGVGIDRSEFKNIFNRFYRIDVSRGKDTGGTGVGLSIVKNIVDKYNGNIILDSKKNEYTIFKIEFNKKEVGL